jgi:2-succinyl-6-hydroxy-2,4-cyclohexadiene-1-carboxylate synthase
VNREPHSLAVEEIGSGSKRIVFAHGFTQTRAAWKPLVEGLQTMIADTTMVLVDLPGHGGSCDVVADVDQSARLLVDVGGDATYVGYSLGARVVLAALVAHPEMVNAAVLISGTAGIESTADRLSRRDADGRLAARIESIGVEAFLAEWLALPLFADLQHTDQGIEYRRSNTVDGLASSLRRCGQGTARPLWSHLPQLSAPVLAIAGSLDDKYANLAERLARSIPNAKHVVIDGAGHNVVASAPEQCVRVIGDWLVQQFV